MRGSSRVAYDPTRWEDMHDYCVQSRYTEMEIAHGAGCSRYSAYSVRSMSNPIIFDVSQQVLCARCQVVGWHSLHLVCTYVRTTMLCVCWILDTRPTLYITCAAYPWIFRSRPDQNLVAMMLLSLTIVVLCRVPHRYSIKAFSPYHSLRAACIMYVLWLRVSDTQEEYQTASYSIIMS